MIGHKVGAALVGTFLGILLSYGFAQPVATMMEHRVTEELGIEHCIKAGILAIHKGFAPAIAMEFARRVVPDDVRPTFEETEKLCRGARTERRRRPRQHESKPGQARRSSSSAGSRRATAAITAARGRWPTRISSPR